MMELLKDASVQSRTAALELMYTVFVLAYEEENNEEEEYNSKQHRRMRKHDIQSDSDGEVGEDVDNETSDVNNTNDKQKKIGYVGDRFGSSKEEISNLDKQTDA